VVDRQSVIVNKPEVALLTDQISSRYSQRRRNGLLGHAALRRALAPRIAEANSARRARARSRRGGDIAAWRD